MVSTKASFSILLSLMFLGCSWQPPKATVKLQKIEPIMFEWEDIVYDTRKGHFILPNVWQRLQEELINRRINANQCIDINNYGLE